MKKIDAHAHIGYYGSFFDVGITAQKLLRQMDDFEIEKAVVSDLNNEEIRKAVTAFPDRLIGAVWINPFEGKKAIEEVKRAITEWQFKAIKIHPLLHAFVANDEIVHPIAKVADELGVPMFMHSGHPPFSLPWSIAQLAEDFPTVKMVMVHMGHGHGVYIQAAIDMAKKYSNLYLETSGMPMHTKIKEAYEQVGPNRIMFGTDAPFHHPSVEIQRAMVSGLDERQLSDLFYNNAALFLGL
ncbi:MAG: amidohydrolase [Deltaproteobacteria bacterium]|nr:MAG: amidohydrolase [Deltaproteobacteria bacterium]